MGSIHSALAMIYRKRGIHKFLLMIDWLVGWLISSQLCTLLQPYLALTDHIHHCFVFFWRSSASSVFGWNSAAAWWLLLFHIVDRRLSLRMTRQSVFMTRRSSCSRAPTAAEMSKSTSLWITIFQATSRNWRYRIPTSAGCQATTSCWLLASVWRGRTAGFWVHPRVNITIALLRKSRLVPRTLSLQCQLVIQYRSVFQKEKGSLCWI